MVQVVKKGKRGTVKKIYTVTRWDGDKPAVTLLIAEVEGMSGGAYKVLLKCRTLKVGADLVGDEERDLMEFGSQFVGQDIEFWPATRPPWIGDLLSAQQS